MIVITEEQRKTLKPYIDNLEDLIQQENVDSLLDAINDLILENILANNDEPDEEGIMLQKIWDAIFYQN